MKRIIYFILISLVSCLVVNNIVLAQTTQEVTPVITPTAGFGFDKVKDVAKTAGYNPDNQPTLDQRISSIISVCLSLLGVIFMILMIYGGYMWMTAQGDEQKVDKAKDVIRAAVIGLVIVVAAYALSVFIITRVWGTTGTTTN